MSDEKGAVGNHDFVDVGTGVISMDLVVLAMKESYFVLCLRCSAGLA